MFRKGNLKKVPNSERIESIKAGVIAAIVFTIAYVLTIVANSVSIAATGGSLWGKIAIALISGFLFGVTYRYIIRTEENSHLKDGAVLAFGLVRGLVFVENAPSLDDNLWYLGVLVAENLICFTLARWGLDIAFHYSLVKNHNE